MPDIVLVLRIISDSKSSLREAPALALRQVTRSKCRVVGYLAQ